MIAKGSANVQDKSWQQKKTHVGDDMKSLERLSKKRETKFS